MASHNDDRPAYERSGRVALTRFAPATLATLLVAAAMAYVWFLAFDAGWGYWLATPVVLVLSVALAANLAVAIGRCRNRFVAGAFGFAAAVVFHAGYFHADLVRQKGPGALGRLDRLPAFIAERMATDGIKVQNDFLPRSEIYNWFYTSVEFLVIIMFVGGLAVYRSLRGYCEICGRWMRSIAFQAKSGSATTIAEALDTGDFSRLPPTVGRLATFGRANSWVEFEYCPRLREPESDCAAYLTLKEMSGGTTPPEILLNQGRLTEGELDDLAGRVAALAWLRVSAPAVADEVSATRSIARHVGPAAAVESLPDDVGGADLDRAGKVEFMLALVPIVALLVGIGLIVWGAIKEGPAGNALLVPGIVAALVGALICWINVDYFGVCYTDRRIRRLIAQRPDALVSADESPGRFVDVVPRAQWHQLVPDKAADRGLLRIDRTGDRILFEGLRERYVIPAAAVLSGRVERMLPHTGNWNLYALVLTVRYPADAPEPAIGGRRNDEWEIPLLPRTTRFRRYSATYRRALAEGLLDEIEEGLGPGDVDTEGQHGGFR